MLYTYRATGHTTNQEGRVISTEIKMDGFIQIEGKPDPNILDPELELFEQRKANAVKSHLSSKHSNSRIKMNIDSVELVKVPMLYL